MTMTSANIETIQPRERKTTFELKFSIKFRGDCSFTFHLSKGLKLKWKQVTCLYLNLYKWNKHFYNFTKQLRFSEALNLQIVKIDI